MGHHASFDAKFRKTQAQRHLTDKPRSAWKSNALFYLTLLPMTSKKVDK